MLFNEIHSRLLYHILFHSGSWSRVRCHDCLSGKTISEDLVYGEKEFIKWCKKFNGQGNCFVGRNPRNKDGSLSRITSISFDIDPIRPKGTPSSKVQLEQSISCSNRILQMYPFGYHAMSGNGSLILFSTPEFRCEDYKAFEQKFRFFEKRLREQLSDYKEVRIDTTYDNSRLVKIIGTISTKGEYRQTRFLRISDIRSRDSRSLFEEIERIDINRGHTNLVEPVGVCDFKSRSEADYALVSFCKQNGWGHDVAHSALHSNPAGRKEERGCTDHIRLINKIYGSESMGQPDPKICVYSPSEHFDEYRERLRRRSTFTTPELSWGWKCFDDITWGLQRGDIHTIGARTGVGKTSFLINLSRLLARSGKSVLYLSTEMSYESIWSRFLAIEGGFKVTDLQRGSTFSRSETDVQNKFKTYKFYVSDTFEPNINTAKKLIGEVKPDVFIFDHIQHTVSSSGNRYNELSMFIRGLKSIARERDLAVVVASQLNRGADHVDYRTGIRSTPSLTHLKECGTIEEESSVVVLLHQQGRVDDNTILLTCSIAKNRNGGLGTFDLNFDESTTRIYECYESI